MRGLSAIASRHTAVAVVILSAERDSRLGEGDLGEDALEVGDGEAVVGDGDALLLGFADAREHHAAVEHTCTTMDDEVVEA